MRNFIKTCEDMSEIWGKWEEWVSCDWNLWFVFFQTENKISNLLILQKN